MNYHFNFEHDNKVYHGIYSITIRNAIINSEFVDLVELALYEEPGVGYLLHMPDINGNRQFAKNVSEGLIRHLANHKKVWLIGLSMGGFPVMNYGIHQRKLR
jgi:hypothetical protein